MRTLAHPERAGPDTTTGTPVQAGPHVCPRCLRLGAWRTVAGVGARLGFLLAAVLAAALALAVLAAPAVAEGASGAVRPVPGVVLQPFQAPDGPYAAGFRGAGLAADPGDPVRVALAGRVTFSGVVAGRPYVTIDHGGGLRTTYADLDPRTVSAGQQVGAGVVLGHLNSGAERFEWFARRGDTYLDPMSLLAAWRPVLVGTH